MQNEVTTVDSETDSEVQTIKVWSPEDALPALTLDEVRFSRGFLRAKCEELFPSLAAMWAPLFERLGVSVTVESIQCSFDFPEEFDRLTPIEFLGEAAVIAFDSASAERLANCVVAARGEQTSGVILEYLERRFIATLQQSWSGNSQLLSRYCTASPPEQIEVAGAVVLTLIVGEQPVKVAIGLGMNAIESIDMQWRELLIDRGASGEPLDALQEFSIELAQFLVPHEFLVDFLKPGNVIPLEQSVSDDVIVMRNGEPWASGQLMQFNGRFAAQIQSPSFAPSPPPPADVSRILATIAVTELDNAGAIELSQAGALLLTREEIAPYVSLFISGEEVAVAEVGEEDGSFILTIVQR